MRSRVKQTKHRHRWKRSGDRTLGKEVIISEACVCGAHRDRPATSVEAREIKRQRKIFWKQTKALHKLWLPILKKFEDVPEGNRCPKCKVLYLSVPEGGACGVCGTSTKRFVYTAAKIALRGWEAMKWMEAYAKKHKEIIPLHVDDSYFCNSNVYLIPHMCNDPELGYDWMGVTLLYIPQCTGEAAINLFLYPDDHTAMIDGLHKMLEYKGKIEAEVRRGGRGSKR